MFQTLRKKIEKHRAKRKFREYGSEVIRFSLPESGEVKFCRWLNPLESEKSITQGQVNFYRKFIQEGDLAIDIGAHIGDTTLPMALAAGKTGMVLAFDPNPYVFRLLQQNATLNPGKTTIIPLNYAVTAHDGDFFYNSSEASFNNGGIAETEQNYHGKFGLKEKVRGINLERYLLTSHPERLSRLKLIKIDAEGYDVDIIRSIYEIIGKYKPYLIFECFRQLGKEERMQLYDLIAIKGYKLYHISDFDENAPLKRIARENMTDWPHFDILARPI